MSIQGWIWKSLIAGLCGTIVHFLFMYFKSRSGFLPSFQPYQALQATLSYWVGTNVPAFVP
ncbi:MAG: acetyl-CoA C-acyltransferase, partial [Pseudolabrys sp.]